MKNIKKSSQTINSTDKNTVKNYSQFLFEQKQKAQQKLDTAKQQKLKKSKLQNFSLYWSDKTNILENWKTTAKQQIKWFDFENLKNFKIDIQIQIDKLENLKNKYNDFENLTQLIDKQINKNLFILQTYTQQIFDLNFDSDTLTKYNFDLLHFDLLLKNECLTNQLLYYRLIDTKKRYIDASDIITNDDFVKTQVYNKTENQILSKLTNQIIFDTILINDKIKLDFLQIYYKNIDTIDKIKKDTNNRKTVQYYKKYILDTYSYLFNDTVIHEYKTK